MPVKKDLFTSYAYEKGLVYIYACKKGFLLFRKCFLFPFSVALVKKNLMHAVRRKVFVGLARYKQD